MQNQQTIVAVVLLIGLTLLFGWGIGALVRIFI
jgi:hypothetical protein